jgi:hypothetical protein
MNRLQVLLEDLRHELTARGGDGGGNARVSDVRGRMTELGNTRETENVPPPAYELC